MKIVIISPYATVVPHFDTELDLAQQHLDRGDKVDFINCMGKLANCDFNLDRTETRCAECIGRREMGLELLTPNVVCHSLGDSPDQAIDENASIELKTEFRSLEELTNYRIDNFDIGYAALSSVVSVCRDPEPDLQKHAEVLKRFLISAWQTYQHTLQYLTNNSTDRVYTFNGRFAAMRAILRASQKLNVDCFLHERGCDAEHYDLYENHLPHDIANGELIIEKRWAQEESNPDREKIGSQWFHDRVNRVEKAWHSFVKDQEQDRLPVGFDNSQRNVAIFCSSDDEFVAIGDQWRNKHYENQVSAIARIARDMLISSPNTRIYARVHPNQKDVDNARMRKMLSLEFPNLTVIPPNATIDSYALVRQSDTVVSFGSSVGCEATFWGKPSVLLGPCFYTKLDCAYIADSHEHAIGLMSKDLEPKPQTGAIKYGFWLQTRGYTHEYFKASGLFNGQFKGQTLYARPPKRRSVVQRLKEKARRLLGHVG